jgi:hypothetical protein
MRNKDWLIKECGNCAKQHTMNCPNSSLCYARDDKPYFEPKSQQYTGLKSKLTKHFNRRNNP